MVKDDTVDAMENTRPIELSVNNRRTWNALVLFFIFFK